MEGADCRRPHETITQPRGETADYEARSLISLELGHEREAIVAIYVGR